MFTKGHRNKHQHLKKNNLINRWLSFLPHSGVWKDGKRYFWPLQAEALRSLIVGPSNRNNNIGISQKQVSNEKRPPGCLGCFGGLFNTTLCYTGLLYPIIGIPIKQTLRITKPCKKEGFGCVFCRGLLDLQTTSDLRSHDSQGTVLKKSGCFGYIGDCTTQLYGIINHDIRIPIKQPGFNGKYPSLCFCGSSEVTTRSRPRAYRYKWGGFCLTNGALFFWWPNKSIGFHKGL